MATKLTTMGGRGPVPFASLMGNMVPLVMLPQTATVKDAESESKSESDPDVPLSSTRVKGTRKRVPSPSCSPAPMHEPKFKSSECDPDARVSSTGLKGERKRVAPSAMGQRNKKKYAHAPSPYSSWSATGYAGVEGRWDRGGRLEVSLRLRIVTSIRTVLDYARGTGHRRKSSIEPFPLLDGTLVRQGEMVLLIVPPQSEATGSHKAE